MKRPVPRRHKYFMFVWGPLVFILIMLYIGGMPPFTPFQAHCHASYNECLRRYGVVLCFLYPVSVGLTWLASLVLRNVFTS